MEWVRTWLVTTWLDTHPAKVEQTAHTATELRTLITEARANPHARRWRHESRRELVGDLPDHCPNGHDISTQGSGAAPHDWWDCVCGGHWWIQCGTCRAELIDPPAAYDCRPHRPARSG